VPFKIRGQASSTIRDDLEFFGFGSSPQSDPRNEFLRARGIEFVRFDQRLTAWVARRDDAALESSAAVLLGLYQKRAVDDFRDEHEVRFSADPAAGRTNDQVYNEVGFRFDTRQSERKISPGFRLESYVGLSNGISGDKGRFRRWVSTSRPYIPVLKRDRVLVPRFIFDTVDDLSETQPLAFTDLPAPAGVSWRVAHSALAHRPVLRGPVARISLAAHPTRQRPPVHRLSDGRRLGLAT
jgi:hypothetical protein